MKILYFALLDFYFENLFDVIDPKSESYSVAATLNLKLLNSEEIPKMNHVVLTDSLKSV